MGDRPNLAGSTSAPIFVAGTGRCGTAQIIRNIGEHPDICAFPQESRFLIDPGGLEDMVRCLTDAYTPFHADDAIRRLEGLLTRQLRGLDDVAFARLDMTNAVEADIYEDWVKRFIDELTWYTFDEPVNRPADKDSATDPPASTMASAPADLTVTRRVGRYFQDRQKLLLICRGYIDELFSSVAFRSGKRTWCEKTPFNLLSMPFLWELFPNARIVHVMRNPVEVVASHLDVPWAPDHVEDVCSWLEPVYRRWLAFRPGLASDDRYIEVRLEDLAADWPVRRAEFFARLGLEDAETASGMDPRRVRHDGRALTAAELDHVRARLGDIGSALGYDF